MRRHYLPFLAVALCGTLVACQPGSEPASEPGSEAVEAPPERVENPELGLAIKDLPEELEVGMNEGETLALSAPGGGTIQLLNGELENSINLVQAAKDHQAAMESKPGGEIRQRNEMMSADFGTTYFSRGRYESETGGLEEEAVLLLIHPRGDRPLTVRYVYPVTAETTDEEIKARIEGHLFETLFQLEGLPVPGAEPASEPEPAGDAG